MAEAEVQANAELEAGLPPTAVADEEVEAAEEQPRLPQKHR